MPVTDCLAQIDACSGGAGDNAIVLSFLSGATAGAAATMASYPFDLLRTLLAAQGKPPVCSTAMSPLELS